MSIFWSIEKRGKNTSGERVKEKESFLGDSESTIHQGCRSTIQYSVFCLQLRNTHWSNGVFSFSWDRGALYEIRHYHVCLDYTFSSLLFQVFGILVALFLSISTDKTSTLCGTKRRLRLGLLLLQWKVVRDYFDIRCQLQAQIFLEKYSKRSCKNQLLIDTRDGKYR